MHRFIEYISDLLFLHDCVIIPDFGGFICNYKSAYIDEANGTICPPGKDIVFNRKLTHNDGLLVNWVASKENISYEKATKQVELFSEDLKVKLNQKQRIAFSDIGVFYTDRRFNIIFESGKNNFLADTYGMEQVQAEKIITEEKKITPRQIGIPTTPSVSPYINMESRNWVHRLLKYGLSAAVVAGIIVFFQFGMGYFDSEINTQNVVNISAVQPSIPNMPSTSYTIKQTVVISPACDYVDYDPLQDLNIQ